MHSRRVSIILYNSGDIRLTHIEDNISYMEIIQEDSRPRSAAQVAPKKASQSIPLRAYFMACARNWYWFVISAVIFTCLAFLYAKSQPQLYSSDALILIKTKDSNSGTQSQVFSDMGVTTGNNYLPNEQFKIRSTKLMETVVNALGVNVSYYGHVFLRDVNIYKTTPLQITPLRQITQPFTMVVVPKGGNDFEFKIDGEDTWKKAHFGNKVNTSMGPIAITKTKNYTEAYKDFKVIVRVTTPLARARSLVGSLKAELADKTSDVMRLSLTTDNNDLGIDLLNALIVAYNQDAINDKNLVARSTESFIADRVEALSKDLSGVDTQVAQLKVSAAGTAMYGDPSTSVAYADRASEVDMQISLATYIQDYLTRMSGHELIPSNTGIANTGIEGQIAQYNEAMLQYQKIAATSSSENPVMIELTNSLTSIKANILRGLANYINSLRIQQTQARSRQSIATGSMVAVPSQEKAITEVTRQQKIKEQLYLYLLNKREENALQLAITEPNAKIIEDARGSGGPIYPQASRIILIGFLLGLLLPAVLLYGIFWYYSLDNMVHTRRDVENMCNIPILGELPMRPAKNDREIVVSEEGRDRMSEAFRIVRNNLDYVVDRRNFEGAIIQFTSTRPGEGKSFVAANLALTSAYSGKHVVAVDLDLRKGRFSEHVGLHQSPVGVSAYLSGNVDDIKRIIKHDVLGCTNFDFIPLGAIPPNPTNLLMSNRFRTMIAELKKDYDYVILDTVPFGLIADAAIINRHVDLTIYVVRDGMVDRRYLEELERMSQEGKIKNLTVLVNDIKIDSKHYGYGGYGYGYGYGQYGYGYGYGYGEDKEESGGKSKE